MFAELPETINKVQSLLSTARRKLKIQPFATENYFSLYEFEAPFPLSCSDCESITISELLTLGGMSEREFGATRLGYTQSQGSPELRAAISELYTSVTPDDIVVLTSPVEGIYLTMRTLLEPGDEVISLTPAYDALNNVVRHICGNVIPWEIRPTQQGWSLDFEELEALISDTTRLVIVNFPHNPTGYVPAREDFDRLLQLVDRHQVRLFCDEIYRGLDFEQTPRIASASDAYSRSLTLCGLSKTYGLPGLRMGWLVIRDHEIREELINWKHYTSICPAAPSEQLSLAALRGREEICSRNVALVTQNLEIADAFFDRWTDHFVWRRPLAGSVGLVELNLDAFGISNVHEYCHRLVQETGVLLLPGDCLGCSKPFVRFGFGRQNFSTGLQVFETHLHSHVGPV